MYKNNFFEYILKFYHSLLKHKKTARSIFKHTVFRNKKQFIFIIYGLVFEGLPVELPCASKRTLSLSYDAFAFGIPLLFAVLKAS